MSSADGPPSNSFSAGIGSFKDPRKRYADPLLAKSTKSIQGSGASFSILPSAGTGRSTATPFVPPAAMFVPGQPDARPTAPAAADLQPAESTASVNSPLPSALPAALHSSASSGPEPSAGLAQDVAVDDPMDHTPTSAAAESSGAGDAALVQDAGGQHADGQQGILGQHADGQQGIPGQHADGQQGTAGQQDDPWTAEDQQWHTYFSELQQWGAYYRSQEGYSEEQVAAFYEASGGGYTEAQIVEYVQFYEAKRAGAAEEHAATVEATVVEATVAAGLHVATQQDEGHVAGGLATVLSTVQEGVWACGMCVLHPVPQWQAREAVRASPWPAGISDRWRSTVNTVRASCGCAHA